MIDDHGYNGDHINGIIDLTEMGLGVRQAWRIDYNINEQKTFITICRNTGLGGFAGG